MLRSASAAFSRSISPAHNVLAALNSARRALRSAAPLRLALPTCVAACTLLSAVPAHAVALPAATPPAPTSLPTTNVGSTSATTTLTFTITSGGTFTASTIPAAGVNSADFAIGIDNCSGSKSTGTCTVTVTFKPLAPGVRLGAVNLNYAGGVVATALIYGTGNGPLVSITPGTLSTVAGSGTQCATPTAVCGDGASATASGADLNAFYGVTVDGAGNIYIADSADNRIRKVTAATGYISTVAGNGTACSSSTAACGDNNAATSANLNYPTAVALDGAGNLYIADSEDNRIRKVTAATGTITTVAGYGTACSAPTASPACGDGAAAISATIDDPVGIAIDGSGNIYIADTYDNRIRKVTASSGVISTVAGNGGSCSNLTAACGDGAAATSANLTNPASIALDTAGNIYIADSGDNRIRKVTGTTISTVAGYGTACSSPTATCGDNGAPTAAAANLKNPTSVAVDAAGNVYIADFYDNRIRKVTIAANTLTTIAGTGTACSTATATCGDNGPATASSFHYTGGVALDGAGNLYIGDSLDNRVRKVTAAAASVTFASEQVNTTTDPAQTLTLTNNGNQPVTFTTGSTNPAISGPPYSLASGSGTCSAIGSTSPYILASGNSCTETISFAPVTVSTTNTGSVTTTDNSNNVASTTQVVALTGASTGTATATALAINPSSNVSAGQTVTLTATITAADSSTPTGTGVQFYDNGTAIGGAQSYANSTSTYADASITAGSHSFTAIFTGTGVYAQSTSSAVALAVNPVQAVGSTSSALAATVTITTAVTLGQIYVLTTGQPNLDYTFASGGSCATGTAYAANATCTVNYSFTPKAPGQRLGAVQLIDSTGTIVMGATLLTGTGTGAAVVFPGNTATTTLGGGFSFPYGAAVDVAGNVYVADTFNNAVKELVAVGGSIPASPTIRTLGSGFSNPTGVAVDGAGNVYVADYHNSAVKEIMAVGGSIPASPTIQTLGSGFSHLEGVAVDGAGNVYVADSSNSAVKEIVAVGGSIPASPTIQTLGSGFNNPRGVAVDGAGNVYVADTFNSAMKEIVAVGGSIPANPTIRTLGSGFNNPTGVAVDGAGNVYVGGNYDNAVKEIVAVGGSIPASPTIMTLGSGFNGPFGVAVDGAGNVYVADQGHNAVKEIPLTVAPTLTFPSTVEGSASAAQTMLLENIGNANVTFSALAVSSSNFSSTGTTCSTGTSIAESGFCNLVASFTPQSTGPLSCTFNATDNSLSAGGSTQSIVLSGTGVTGSTAQTITFPQPGTPGTVGGTATLMATASSGLAVTYSITSGPATLSGSTISYTGAGTVIIAANQPGNGTYAAATTVSDTVTVIADYVWLVNANATISRLSDSGSGITNSGTTSGSSILGGIAFDASGNTWSVTGANNVLSFTTNSGSGSATYTGGGLSTPVSLAVDGAGYIWIANSGNNSISEFSSAGSAITPTTGFTGTYQSGTTTPSYFASPSSLVLDPTGGIWVTNKTGNSVTHVFGASTPVTTPLSNAVTSSTLGTKP